MIEILRHSFDGYGQFSSLSEEDAVRTNEAQSQHWASTPIGKVIPALFSLPLLCGREYHWEIFYSVGTLGSQRLEDPLLFCKIPSPVQLKNKLILPPSLIVPAWSAYICYISSQGWDCVVGKIAIVTATAKRSQF